MKTWRVTSAPSRASCSVRNRAKRRQGIEFGRRAGSDRAARGDGKPETFDFLGFTHICSRSRQGGFQLARHTRRDRKRAKLLEISEELRRRWHQSVAEQGAWPGSMVRGFFVYHAIPTNTRALSAFRYHVADLWRRALRRRSQKDRTTWTKVDKPAERGFRSPGYLIPGRLNASASNTQGGSRMREFRTSGSVWGAPGDGRPYRDQDTRGQFHPGWVSRRPV
jgi:hypothetical protein